MIKNIIALMLVAVAFRGEIIEYSGPILEGFRQINSVVEIEKPDQDNLDIVKSTEIDDREYTANDALMLAIFHDKLADDIGNLDVESESIQNLIDHHVNSLNGYVKSNKLEKKYPGLTEDIKQIMTVTFGIKSGVVDKEVITEYSETCQAIAWVLINN